MNICYNSTHSPDAADWFHERKDEFATTKFLDDGLPCYGNISNNAAEQTNSGILANRRAPIVDMSAGMARRISKQFLSRSALLLCCFVLKTECVMLK